MAYTVTNWQDGTTPVDASNLNKLEQAVSDNADSIDALSNSMTVYATSREDLFTQIVNLGASKTWNIFLSTNAVSELTNGAVSAIGFGISACISASYVDFAFFANNSRTCYSGRITTGGELYALYRLSPTSVSI